MSLDDRWDRRPNPARTGQGYTPYTPEQLDEIAANIAPALDATAPPRLHADDLPRNTNGTVQVPEGYDWLDHPNRAGAPAELLDAEFPTRADGNPPLPAPLAEVGHGDRDQHGRLLHPHWRQLVADRRIGLRTGLGQFYCWGEATIADAVLWRERDGHAEVRLTLRDTPHEGRIPALPGGFTQAVDDGLAFEQWRTSPHSTTLQGLRRAAIRKAREETGLPLTGTEPGELMRLIRPVSSVATLHAWTAVGTVLIRCTSHDIVADDHPGWHRIDQLATVLPRMWPDHRRALLAAITPGATPLTTLSTSRPEGDRP